MPQREHEMSLRERKEVAYSMFARGSTNSDIRNALGISRHTALRYRTEYETSLSEQAENNPNLLRDVLQNTVRALRELDEVRTEAWMQYELAQHPAVKKSYLDAIIKAQEQRHKLLGLFGVKAEYMMYVQNVKMVQDRLIAWMREHLCEEDRTALEEFFATSLAPYMDNALPPVEITAESGLRRAS